MGYKILFSLLFNLIMGEITPKKMLEGNTSIISLEKRSKPSKQPITLVSADNMVETRTRNKRSTVSLEFTSPKVNDKNGAKKPKTDNETNELDNEKVLQGQQPMGNDTISVDVVDNENRGVDDIVRDGTNIMVNLDMDGRREGAENGQNGNNDKNKLGADDRSALVVATNKISPPDEGTDVDIISKNVVHIEGGKNDAVDMSCENGDKMCTANSVENQVVPNGITAEEDETQDQENEKMSNLLQKLKNGKKENNEENTPPPNNDNMDGDSSAEEAEPSPTADRSHGLFYQAGAKAYSWLGKLNPFNWRS